MYKKKSYLDYQLLHKVEVELNSIRFKGLEIGRLMSFYFDRIYSNNYNTNLLRRLLAVGYYFFKVSSKRKLFTNYEKEIIYYRTGLFRHHRNLQGVVTDCEYLSKKTLIVAQINPCDLDSRVFFSSSVLNFFEILSFVLSNLKRVNRSYSKLGLKTYYKVLLVIDLTLQLLKSNSLMRFIKLQTETKLICADYDRGEKSSLFFAVSRLLNKKSFTFQHGVLNPPVGYSPVNADEIWVWGEFAKKQLLELGVTSSKINITGTPIIQNIEISGTIRNNVVVKHRLKQGKSIVLALSAPNKPNDIKLVDLFSKIKIEHGSSQDNFLVKIHPARNYEEYKWIQSTYDLDLLPHDIPYQEFMNIVDLLLAHSSGIATEVLYYKKKVGILDILDDSPGNGLELHKHFNIPLIKNVSDYPNVFIDWKHIRYDSLFYKVGIDAKSEIQNKIINSITTS